MNLKSQISNLKSGFTVVEILIVIAIATLLVSFGVAALRSFQFQVELNTASQKIVTILRTARTKTLASEGASSYGVHFDDSNGRFIFFKGNTYNPNDPDNISYDLSESVEISSVDLAGDGMSVVFARVEGTTINDGNVVISSIRDESLSKTIYIQSSGQIAVDESGTTPTDNRIKDSRHVHFDLGWSIRDATQLKFNFISAGQTETAVMASYFNSEKTEFDWSRTFSIEAQDQVFRVHTHSLDPFNTLFCIHRDRNEGKNNQEVKIYIIDAGVDKEIAHYLADTDDTVLKGNYVWNTIERQ